MTTTTIHPDWYEHPLVAKAIELSDGDPVSVLENLHGALSAIDGRKIGGHRGLSIDEILTRRANPHRDGRSTRPINEAAAALRNAGHTEAEVQAILAHDGEPFRFRDLSGPEKRERIEDIRSKYKAGWPLWLLAKYLGIHRETCKFYAVGSGVA